MYSILEHYLSTNHILMIGMIVTFILTFFLLEHPFSFLPSDQGLDKIVLPNKDEAFLRTKILEMYTNPLKNFFANQE